VRLAILILLCAASACIAQPEPPPTPILWIGAQGGIDVGKFYNSTSGFTPPSDRRVGAAGGLSFEFWFSTESKLGVATEFLYLQKGADVSYAGIEQSTEFSYFAIPLMIKFSSPISKIRPYVQTGIQCGVFQQGTITTDMGDELLIQHVSDDEVEKINMSIVVGAGISYDLSRSVRIFLSGLFDFGLSNLNPDRGDGEDKIYTLDNRLTVGIAFGIPTRPSLDADVLTD